MSSARLVRSTKSRLFLYVCALLAFCIVVYMFHGSQLQLDDNRKALASCNQQTESLSAQLQVILEYKLRLEKSLQKEKTDHKQAKEECHNRAKQEKDDRDRELVEEANKYSALQQSLNLLQTKQKDLDDENNELRKKNLKLVEEMEIQRKQLSGKLTEEQRIRLSKEKAIENVKNRVLELEVQNGKLKDENEQLKKDLPESSRVQMLEKAKIQLERELETVKLHLESCRRGSRADMQQTRNKSPENNHSAVAVEPPNYLFVNKFSSNATTPVINPEAVIEHDISSSKPSLAKSTKTIVAASIPNKATQEAAAPIQVPLKQAENVEDMEMNRQIPMPNNMEPQHQLPENTVIKKPDFADTVEKRENIREENNPVGPMNPIQEPVVHSLQGEGPKHKAMLVNQWEGEEEGPQNGAHEEAEDDLGPGPLQHHSWRGDEGDNRVLPKHMNHDYQGVEYDKDNQEEDEDGEGEQMDYVGGDSPRKLPKFPKVDHHSARNVGGVMLNPKK